MITLKTLSKASAQEVFDQVATHLLKQNEKSTRFRDVSQSHDCAYRGENGKMCAAGCLMADNEYAPEWDSGNVTWDGLVVKYGVPNHHKTLISCLQSVHDAIEPQYWRIKLASVAEAQHLNTNVLDKVA